jgi:hypothetical protein
MEGHSRSPPILLPGGAKYGDVPVLLALGRGNLREAAVENDSAATADRLTH